MEDVLKYHGILQKMDPREKVNLIHSLVESGGRENLPLLFELLGDSNYDFRRAAFSELKKFGDEIIEDVSELLRTGNEDQRYFAVQLLVNMGEKAVSALELSLNEGDPTLQRLAIDALGKYKSPGSVRPLLKMFSEGGWAIRQDTYRVLLSYGESIMPVLKEQLNSPNEDIVYWTIRLLGSLGYKSRKTLFEFLQKADPEMKFAVASALGESGDKHILGMLVKCFQDPSWIQKRRASDALIQIKGQAADAILEGMKKVKAKDLYWYAHTLANLGQKGFENLAEFLSHKSESYLWDCREELCRVGNKLTGLIEELLKIEGKGIRFFTWQLCADLDSEESMMLLVEGLNDANWTCKRLCADALVKHGDAAVKILKNMSNTAKDEEMFWLIYILKRSENGRAIVASFLRKESKYVVAEAAKALRGFVGPESVLPLLHCLQSEHWIIRKESADSLIEAGVIAMDKVVESLAIEESELRYWISYILKAYPSSMYAYLTTLLYRDDFSKSLCAEAMGIIGDKFFVMPLQGALKSPDPVLVLKTSWALSRILKGEEILALWGLLSQMDVQKYPMLEDLVFEHQEFAKEHLLHGLNTIDSTLVKNCIYLCGKLNIEESVPRLKQHLLGKNEEFIIMAADAFMEMKYTEITEDFHQLLEGEISDDLRLKLLSVLGAIAEEEVIYLILKIIQNAKSEQDRNRYAQEVFRMGLQAIPQLIDALGRDEIPVRKAAAELLLEFGGLAVPYLQKEQMGKDPNRKFWASKILKAIHSNES